MSRHQEESDEESPVSCAIGGPAPPVESLLAHITSQLETGGGIKPEIDGERQHKSDALPVSVAAADQQTKEWLYSNKVGVALHRAEHGMPRWGCPRW